MYKFAALHYSRLPLDHREISSTNLKHWITQPHFNTLIGFLTPSMKSEIRAWQGFFRWITPYWAFSFDGGRFDGVGRSPTNTKHEGVKGGKKIIQKPAAAVCHWIMGKSIRPVARTTWRYPFWKRSASMAWRRLNELPLPRSPFATPKCLNSFSRTIAPPASWPARKATTQKVTKKLVLYLPVLHFPLYLFFSLLVLDYFSSSLLHLFFTQLVL